MPNITLSLPDDIYKMIKKHREIRWSEVVRVSLIKQVKKLELMNKIASKSKLTMKDIEEINEKIKKNLYSKVKK